MSDIFQEVDEEVRRERLQQLWERHSVLIVGAALLIVVGIGGWRGYQWWEAKRAAENGARFETALSLVTQGKHEDAQAAFAQITDHGTSGYRTLARLQEAAEIGRHDVQGGVKAYDAIAADSGVPSAIRDLARVRAGMLLVDTASLADMNSRLEAAAAAGRPFRHTARELMAFAAWRNGNAEGVRRWFDTIVADPESPQPTRTRVEMLTALAAPDAKS